MAPTQTPMSNAAVQDHLDAVSDYHFFYNPFNKAITINELDFPSEPFKLFFTRPLYAPFLFPNTSSDARDHAANERTYLSYLRLAVYLAIVSVAIILNFHLKNQPTSLEMAISRPLGIIFFVLALACLTAGFANYVRTVAKYARKAALVQSGLKTQIVFGVVSCAIIAACGVFIAAEAQRASSSRTANSPTNVTGYQADDVTKVITAEAALLRLIADMGGLSAAQAQQQPDRFLNAQQP